MTEKVDILGIKIDKLTHKEAIDKIKSILMERKNIKIFTPNPIIIMQSLKDKK